MQPQIVLNWGAIVVSAFAAFFFGYLWYGPLFGKVWGKEMGMSLGAKPSPEAMKKMMMKGLIIQLVGLFLMAFVLAHANQVWRPSVWGVGEDQPSCVYGFFGALFTWLGFLVPLQLNKVAWEMKSWKVFIINAGHDIINLLIMSMILSYWR